jgi:hypothetical protein
MKIDGLSCILAVDVIVRSCVLIVGGTANIGELSRDGFMSVCPAHI